MRSVGFVGLISGVDIRDNHCSEREVSIRGPDVVRSTSAELFGMHTMRQSALCCEVMQAVYCRVIASRSFV